MYNCCFSVDQGIATMFIRFVRPNKVEGLAAREGIFCAAYEMRYDPDTDPFSLEALEELLTWFRQNLTIPKKFNRTKSKGYRQRKSKGLSWYKNNATEAIAKSFELQHLLEDNGYSVEIIRTERVGYIVFEDENQIIAEPFSDTPT